MSLLTVPQLREHIETDLKDEALGRMMASEEAYINEQVGTDDAAGSERRRQVLVDLIKLSLRYEGLVRSGVGNVSFEVGSYADARYAIVATLFPKVQVG